MPPDLDSAAPSLTEANPSATAGQFTPTATGGAPARVPGPVVADLGAFDNQRAHPPILVGSFEPPAAVAGVIGTVATAGAAGGGVSLKADRVGTNPADWGGLFP